MSNALVLCKRCGKHTNPITSAAYRRVLADKGTYTMRSNQVLVCEWCGWATHT